MYKVLVVDDEPVIRKGLSKLIQGCSEWIGQVSAAENGEDALRCIRDDEPDLLFTDIRMPRMDGLELCRRVSEQYPDIQMVIITGYDDFEYARKSIIYGVKDYILKPVTKKQVEDAVSRVLTEARKRSQSQLPVTVVTGWSDRLVEAIWTLDESAAEALTEEVATELRARGVPGPNQQQYLQELIGIASDTLKERDPALGSRGDGASPGTAESLQDFIQASISLLRLKRRGKTKDPIEEAKRFIEEHISRDFSLDEVAERIGLNASYFSQLFRQTTGVTFAHYRIERRIERAKQLLAIPHQKITDVSYEVGYADHPHFTKTFKKVTGFTPSEYRDSLGIDR